MVAYRHPHYGSGFPAGGCRFEEIARSDIPAARTDLAKASADFETARQAYADASMQLTRSRLALALDGTSRGSLRAHRDTAAGTMATAAQNQRTAQDHIKELTTAASEPYRPATLASPWREGQATADLDHLTSTWDTQHIDAITHDIQTARSRTAQPGDQALETGLHVTTPAQARKTAAEITAELQHRASQTPEQALSDDIERARSRQPSHQPSATPLLSPYLQPGLSITPGPDITP
jgi:hypothetical protein